MFFEDVMSNEEMGPPQIRATPCDMNAENWRHRRLPTPLGVNGPAADRDATWVPGACH